MCVWGLCYIHVFGEDLEFSALFGGMEYRMISDGGMVAPFSGLPSIPPEGRFVGPQRNFPQSCGSAHLASVSDPPVFYWYFTTYSLAL